MAISVSNKNSPGWWLEKCFQKRAAGLARFEELDAWRRGNPPAPQAVKEAREAFKEFESESVTNWAQLIIALLRERLGVRDIRTGASGDDPDDEAWAYWLTSNLDVEFSTFVDTMLWAGDAYAMVGEDDDGEPSVTPQDPRDVVTFHDPIKQSRYRAAARFLHDADAGKDYVYLMLAGSYFNDNRARVFVASKAGNGTAATSFDSKEWSWDRDYGGVNGEALNHELVPVVRLRNTGGMGEFEPFLPQLRRINRFTFQLSVIVLYQAYKQRAILADVDDPEQAARDGLADTFNVDDLEDVLTSDPGSWFLLPSGSKIWESTQADTQGLVQAIKAEQLSLAAVARRPMGMFAPDNQSASGANFTREGLTFAVEDKQKRLRRFLVDVFHLVFLTAGDEKRADKKSIRVSFTPADRYTITDKASATSQVSSVLPLRTILREIWQMSPDEIRAVESEAADAALLFSDGTEADAGPRMTIDEISKAAESLRRLQMAAVTNESAADIVGLEGLKFNQGRSVALKFPDE